MADANSVWIGASTTAFGVLLGFALNSTTGLLKAHFERRGHWLALRADILRCGDGGAGYLEGGVKVPAGRLPITSYTSSFPALLMAELLSQADVEALSRFFANADNFNRSLDLAQDALGTGKSFEREVERAQLKAVKIAAGKGQYVAALTCVDRHLKRRTGHWLLVWK